EGINICMGIYPELSNYDISQTVKEYEQQVTTVEPGYYYTSDHLGSSSYITDDNGSLTQSLAYLPYGEDWVDLKHNNPQYQTPYKFNGKEKDEESGYHYYGARYYYDWASIWLSVDPMSDKYPHVTNYIYCSNNPVMVVDPDGMDEWEVNQKGEVNWIKQSKKHTMYALDENGNRSKKSLTLNNRNIFDQLAKKNKAADGKTDMRKAVGGENSQTDMAKTFMFMAENTTSEWRIDRFDDNGKSGYSLGTLLNSTLSPSAEDMGHSGLSVITMIHSHPLTAPNISDEVSSMGWNAMENGKYFRNGDSYYKSNSNMRNANYYTYFPQSGRLWEVTGRQPNYIRNINSNSSRLFFGTLNTR
ncbi:MAG: RHS repeat-associated core domain-containing protein, partial [Bacteroidales bacterium]